MDWDFLIRMLASILAESSPMVYACIGETITEKAGVINLSLDGSILLSAMTGFAVAYTSGSLVLGLLSAMGIGALVALIVVVAGIELRQDQVAVGFILTLLTADLSSFLGNPFVRKPGPEMPHLAIPILKDLPIVGPLFFNHNLFTYGSFILVFLAWFWIFKTGPGLALRGVGERPEAAFARGISVRGVRYLYPLIGGSLVGLAGANFSLSVKLGWSYQHTLGIGWICLAIVIFGGWHPFKAALGTYLFGGLQSLGILFQGVFPTVPIQVFQVAPFVFMIVVLALVGNAHLERMLGLLPGPIGRSLAGFLRFTPPSGLGKPFERE
jgi:general nucleoside transport system permease protein